MEGGGAGKQIERLKHETDLFVADARQLVVVHSRNFLIVQRVAAFAGRIETADQVHQRRFTRAGRPHDGDVFAALDGDRDTPERMDLLAPHEIRFPEIVRLNESHE